jgi:glycosyltransferase involved in cell wall biosynthesis
VTDTQGLESVELTVLMPCLDEAETLAICVDKAAGFLRDHGVVGEIVIADNGSTDGSQDIAREHGARVVDVPVRGYGAALMGGIEAARGRYVIMADADDSYDFTALMPFLEKLRDGWQLVMGNRFAGGIAPGAMPPLHRYLGNPVLTGIGNVLFRSPVRDFHCGLRGFEAEAMRGLGLRTTGMEFASEMVVKASLTGMRITEVPTTLSPDGRTRPPHLRSWRDGWRHLRFLLIYSPSWLFLYPGLVLGVVGVLGMSFLATGDRTIGHVTFSAGTLLYAALATIVGFEAVSFARFLKYLGARSGELPHDRLFERLESVLTLERTLLGGLALILLGIVGTVFALVSWEATGFGNLPPASAMRLQIPSVTALILGVQSVFSAFFMYALRSGPGYRD